jgi:dTDP-glucose pyrophosphorylase
MNMELFIADEDISVRDAMEKINGNNEGIVFLCNQRKLLACATDGDIRRFILRGGELSTRLSSIANYNPVFLKETQKASAKQVMQRYSVTAVPIVNRAGEVVEIRFRKEEMLQQKDEKAFPALNLPLVIMAGGKGTRLKPYTDILPKPLIPVDDKTITEHIIEKFVDYKCCDVTMIVNYKKDFIKAYFNDSDTNGKIKFIEEQEYRGTGGGLKLLQNNMKGTFFMSNCDILVNADYSEILEYHRKSRNLITMVCARKKFIIPYGTVRTNEEGQVTGLEEKPEFMYQVNTGLYLIEPAFLGKIPDNTAVHITDVIEKCIAEKERVGTYLIDDDQWMDMGQLDELEKMKKYFLQGGQNDSR